MNLAGAIVVLTGGSRGIGAAAARELAARGCKLALAARSEGELEAVRADIAATGPTVIAIPTDVTDPDDRDGLLQRVEGELGPPDVLVNNAGIEVIGPFRDRAMTRSGPSSRSTSSPRCPSPAWSSQGCWSAARATS